MRVKDILDIKGSAVITVAPTAKLGSAIDILADQNVGALVVVESGLPVGILSERDVIRLLAGAPTGLRDHTIGDMMTKDLVTVAPEASIDEVMDLMTDRRIRHMPVLVNNKLVGILSIGDVVKHRIREAREEAEALKGYISG